MIKNNCRLCSSSKLKIFLDLGSQPPSDQFIKAQKINDEKIFYPLKVANCMKCGFKQLNYVVNPKVLYQDDYPYESSTTKAGSLHFDKFAENVIKEFNIPKKSIVLDIGSNVGVLLSSFRKRDMKVVGVDPASNICKIANSRGIKTFNNFFNNNFTKIFSLKYKKAKVITATNVFAHVDNLKLFIQNIKKILDQDGIFIIEAPHFLNLVKKLEYDTIYHEHLSYITVHPLISFFRKFELEIIQIQNSDIHGGSIRIFISRKNKFKIHKSVKLTLNKEKNQKLNNFKVLQEFSKKVANNKYDILKFLISCKKNNKSVVGLSAPAKGMTLLNFSRIDNHFLDYVTEKSKLKIGRFTPGGNLEVFSDKKLLKTMPDYALILAWNFQKEIIKNNNEYLKKGGKFIIPIPKLKIISKNNYKK